MRNVVEEEEEWVCGPRPVPWPPANFSTQCSASSSAPESSRVESRPAAKFLPPCQLGLQPAEEEGGEKIANSKFLIVAYVTSKEKLRVAFQKEYCIRARSKRGRYREIHPQCQRDFPRPERCSKGNLEGRGGGFPNNSQVLVEYGHFIHHQSFPMEWTSG